MRESAIQRKIIKALRREGCFAYKWECAQGGMPDLIVLCPGGVTRYMEVKTPTGELRKLQIHRIKQFFELGHTIFVVSSPEAAVAICRKKVVSLTDYESPAAVAEKLQAKAS